ncbi:MAG: triosephosphate isomerase [Patescibacteria group bacterium]|nr:triosephosphate isomerase [Patescibacteria group bacterium]MDE2116734.1 triosephosphate isomerase [Patescibacteria group bacterium]
MKSQKRNFIIAGNWKMNPDSLADAKTIFAAISRKARSARHTVVVLAPPAPFLSAGASRSGRAGTAACLAIQDVSEHVSGAFTGSVSARQARSAGAEYAIIGHSERRKAGDTDMIVSQKVRQALDAGLRTIVCVGETERDPHAHYLRTVREQILAVVGALDKKQVRSLTHSLIVAYEPVWAVGKSYDTAPKPSDIHEMSIYIKKVIAESLGKKIGIKIPVLYGGSVDLENSKAILKDGGIDGLLVGRQSLDSKDFGGMIDYADSL